ncbi:MAG: putative porin [Tannerella sp.]|jgi:hypothetical protein|nr:putative porin [Tannerella sp.]
MPKLSEVSGARHCERSEAISSFPSLVKVISMLLLFTFSLSAQIPDTLNVIPNSIIQTDSIIETDTTVNRVGRKGITPKLSQMAGSIPDSIMMQDTTKQILNPVTAFRVTEKTGERYIAPMDTQRLNFFNSTLIDGRGLSVGYLANIGSPAQSRIFSEREEDGDFIFANGFNCYITKPTNALWYDVKDPYTRLTYLRSGGQKNREEMFNGVLTSNFGKQLNVGLEWDYTYVRGQYTSNANKMLYYRPFASYRTDRYEVMVYMRNYNYLNTENGGLTEDRYVSHPDEFTDNKRPIDRQSYPTRFTNTWNRNKGGQFYLTHRYNLGFYREMTDREREEASKKKELKKELEEQKKKREEEEALGGGGDPRERNRQLTEPVETAQTPPANVFGENPDATAPEEEEIDAVFVPVSSIIHTFEYEKFSRRFISYFNGIDEAYLSRNDSVLYGSPDSTLNDYTKSWNIKNTIGLSLREGFQDWAKFGVTAFVHFEKRRFTLPGDSVRGTMNYDEFSTYLGGELSKQRGELLTYKARGEMCIVGSDLGEFNLEGELRTRFPLMGKEASIRAFGYIRNLTPAFYQRHHHSRYFWWDKSLKNSQKVLVGGEIDLEQTQTRLSANVQSIQNYVYFGAKGTPEQYESNLQVITARIRQDFRYKAFGWENEAAWQLSSEQSVLPLPQICAYSNIYLDFTYAKVLNIQLGVDAHYFTAYHAPYYEPATQQFQIQEEKNVGDYPLINAYANFRLKQARFFIAGYNVGSLLFTPAYYFSMLHYPLNPMLIKLGISVYFNN